MAKKDTHRWRRQLVNALGALGYLVVIVQWVVSLALFVPLLEQADFLFPEKPPVSDVPVVPSTPVAEPSLFTFIGVAVLVLVMLAVTLYIAVKLPASLARTSRKVVHQSSDALSGALLRVTKKKDTKKQRERLAPRVVLFLKVVLVFVPVLLALLARLVPESLADPLFALFISAFLSNIAVLLFLLQYSTARLLTVKPADLW